jgi:hypothetical protein
LSQNRKESKKGKKEKGKRKKEKGLSFEFADV